MNSEVYKKILKEFPWDESTPPEKWYHEDDVLKAMQQAVETYQEQNPIEEKATVFTKGDIISNSDKSDMRFITKVEDGEYHFVNLKSHYIKDISGKVITFEKGSEGSQPFDIVDKYFYLVQL